MWNPHNGLFDDPCYSYGGRFSVGKDQKIDEGTKPVKVTSENYQDLAERTSATADEATILNVFNRLGAPHSSELTKKLRLLHAFFGLATESGELMDALKKHLFYGKNLDERNIREELGDLLWYVAEAMNALDVRFDDLLGDNIEKLRKRYPDMFTEDKALNRDTEAEIEHYDK